MQSTLKRGLYAPKTTVLQAFGSCFFAKLAQSGERAESGVQFQRN